MRETDVKTTPDGLEALDFQPACSVSTITAREHMLKLKPKECEHPAKWVGYSPCCGIPVLVCDEHHASPMPFQCQRCNKGFPTLINWQPL